jgi:uncharacterized protein YcnI
MLLAASAAALAAATAAGAHGTLTPTTAPAGTTQRFELTVPNDRLDADVVGVALRLPPEMALQVATANQPRWSVATSGGEIVWSGGPIPRGGGETFAFTAALPSDAGQVELALVETYDDGAGAPFPIVVTVAGTAATSGGSSTLAVAALVVALGALGLATAALAIALRGRARTDST